MQRRILTIAGLALSIALIVYIATAFDLAGALRSMRMASPLWLLAATVAYSLQFPLRGLRWAVLMRALKPVRWSTATQVFTIGFMANNVLPARLGDVARAFVLADRERIPASATFSNVMLERVFDGLTVVGILSVVLWLEPPSQPWVQEAALVMAAIFAAAVTVSALVVYNERLALDLARLVLRPVPERLSARALGLLGRLSTGLHTLRSARETLIVSLLSVVIWCAEVVVYVFVARAFQLDISPLGLAMVMAILSLGLTAPSAPGFVGVYEGLVIKALDVYGIGDPVAPAFAITMHLIHFIPGTILGLAFTYGSGLRFRDIRAAQTGGGGAAPPDQSATLRTNETTNPELELG